jgi:hypothetical protein
MSLVKALTKTLQFEKEMRTKFEQEESKAIEAGVAPAQKAQRDWLQSLSKEGNLSDSGGLVAGTASASVTAGPPGPPSNDSKLEGMISEAFVRYMGSYVAWERSELEKIIRDAPSSDTLESCESMPVFRSSPELFSQVHGHRRTLLFAVCQSVCLSVAFSMLSRSHFRANALSCTVC